MWSTNLTSSCLRSIVLSQFFLFCSACCCCYCRHCLFVFVFLYRPFIRKIPLYFWFLCVHLSKTDPNYIEGYYYCACSIVFETKCHFHNVKSSEWTHRNRKMSKYIIRPMYVNECLVFGECHAPRNNLTIWWPTVRNRIHHLPFS